MKSSHILGLNARNHLYQARYNTRAGKRIADSKLLTKKFLTRWKIPHPRLIARFENAGDVARFEWESLSDNFVVKPAGGNAGEGIILIRRRISRMVKNGYNGQNGLKQPDHFNSSNHSSHFGHSSHCSASFQLMDRSRMSLDDVKLHVLDILEGRFDKYDLPGTAMIEERIPKHPQFRRYAYQGTPDVRVIVFNRVPVMAALRLPTPESKGRANIHQGAIMAGVDLATGLTTRAILWDRAITRIPSSSRATLSSRATMLSSRALRLRSGQAGSRDLASGASDLDRFARYRPVPGFAGSLDSSRRAGLARDDGGLARNDKLPKTDNRGLRLSGIQIPFWDRILSLAVEVSAHIALGYMAVDFLLDDEKGPLVVELTARPGLGIQLANGAGLKRRLERVEGLDVQKDRGIEVGKALFAESFADKIIAQRGVKVVSVFETVNVRDARGTKHEVQAKVDTGAFRTSIDEALARELGLLGKRSVLWHDTYVSSLGRERRPIIQLTVWLGGRKIETAANVSNRAHLKQKLLIGRRDLSTFLVRPGQ